MSLTKVSWSVSLVKNMHPGLTSDPSGTASAEAKPRCVYSILKPSENYFDNHQKFGIFRFQSSNYNSVLLFHVCKAKHELYNWKLWGYKIKMHKNEVNLEPLI